MAHRNTIFRQLLQLLDRNAFDAIERKGFQPKRKYRTLTRWGQLVAMMFAHITDRSSLRDIEEQFRFKADNLYHLGIRPVKRSTLADANNTRPAGFFESLFGHQYAKCVNFAPKKRFRFKNKLYSFDDLGCGSLSESFPLGQVSNHKGRYQTPCPPGSRRLYPCLCQNHRSKSARHSDRQNLKAAHFLNCRSGPGLCGFFMVQETR